MRRMLAVVVAAAAALLPASPAAAVSPDVVINEVYGGGGNSGAIYRNDFVELYNSSAGSVSLSGWSVRYASASGSTWATTTLAGSIAPGGFYLIQFASGGSAGAPLPTPDRTGTTNLSATSGKVALHTASALHDLIGYGSANNYEGNPAPAGSNTKSLARKVAGVDTDNNQDDFAAGTPTPTNSSGGSDPCAGYPATRIRAIQGSTHLSPLSGTQSTRGVVTAVASNGFWIQDPCPDASVSTSEGLFVFTQSAPSVVAGDEVNVTGNLSEYRPGGASSDNLTTTELTSPSVTKLGTRAIPAAVVVGGGGRVPPNAVIDNDASGSVETSGTFDPTTDGIDFWESLEGMRVEIAGAVAVGPRNKFNEIPVVPSGSGVRTNRGGIVIQSGDFNPERVILDDRLAPMPAANTGDTFSGALVGVLDYAFGNFNLLPSSTPTLVSAGLTAESTSPTGAGQLSAATFNVENLDPNDPQSKFDSLTAVIVNNLAAPDLLALEEVQDNDGATNSSVRAIDPNAAIIVLGDINDFDFSTTANLLVGAGELVDLPRTLPVAEQYTYVYQGNSQVLDHILLSSWLATQPYAYDIVHVNSEFTNPVSDHDPQVVKLTL